MNINEQYNGVENQGEFQELIAYLKTFNDQIDDLSIIKILKSQKLQFPIVQNVLPEFQNPRIKQVTDNLLYMNNQYETEESRLKKEKVLKMLQDIVTDWSITIAEKEKQIYREQLQRCGAILLPYGSFLLGVTGQDSDLDLVCVATQFIDRKIHFFDGLYEILKQDQNVTKINKIEISFNPIIKLEYCGFQVDINFAQINRDTIPVNIDDELDDLRRTIEYTERPSIDALNGRQNGLMIRNSVQNERQFIETLRIIKLWSKKRCVTGNIVGFLGGISWAILVAKICKIFPNLNTHQTVYLFFQFYSRWDWMYQIEIELEQNMTTFQSVSWPANAKPDELMKIITPAIPCINSASKVNLFSFKAVCKEIRRARDILCDNQIEETQRWERLIEQYDLFDEFRYYLTISIVSNNTNDFHKWSGFCEAQLVSLQETIGEHLCPRQKRSQYINEEQMMDDQNNSINDKYEIRMSNSGYPNYEIDFRSSYTYFLGIKKLDRKTGPLFLIVPVAKFADKIIKNKLRQNFSAADNMKLYFSHKTDLNSIQQKSTIPDTKRKMSQEQIDDFECISKKIKPDQITEQARIMSQEPQNINQEAMEDILDDLF